MRLTHNIEKLIKKLRYSASAETHDRILGNILKVLEKKENQKPAAIEPDIWRIIMKSKITKFAAAAVIIIGIFLAMEFFGRPSASGVVYGMVDLPIILERANTINTTSWRYLDDSAIVSNNKSERIRFDFCIDKRRERVRWSQFGMETIIDGQILTKINHHDGTISFYKLSDFQRMVWVRKMWDWNFPRAHMSNEGLLAFVKVGRETIDSTELDIWETTRSYWYPSDREIKVRVWMSPTTGEVKRFREWQRGEFTKGRWCITSDEAVEIDQEIENNAFDLIIPEGYRLDNTIETAPEYRFLILAFYAGGKRSEVRYVFVLENGIVIMVWSTGIQLSNDDSLAEYEVLKPGWSLPTKPVEILYGLTPRGKPKYDSSDYNVIFDDRNVIYTGRHLALTRKEGQLYEWTIYVPNKYVYVTDILPRCEIVIGMDPENRTWKGVEHTPLDNNAMVIYDNEFDRFVIGAMAELSDDGKAPEDITHQNVLHLAKLIKESLSQ